MSSPRSRTVTRQIGCLLGALALLASACLTGEEDEKTSPADNNGTDNNDNNGQSNNGTSNNGTSNNGTSNNGDNNGTDDVCTAGDTRDCECGDGETGTETCLEDGSAWDVCEGCPVCTDMDGDGAAVEPGCTELVDCNDARGDVRPGAPELCDGVDNDCNGTNDDGAYGIGTPCVVQGQMGACGLGETQCNDGNLQCVQINSPTDEVCNLVDDDCNGSADEGNPGGGEPCLVANAYGICREGVRQCRDGQLTCAQTVFPREETCDGVLDEDCNGAIDDRQPDGCPCSDGAQQVCGSDEGTCATGTRHCVDGFWSSTCEGEVRPTAELCDGLDNNCDGTPDDGDPGGGPACQVPGLQGACADGVLHCNDGDLVCTQTVFPRAELCNGIDDDCDGTVDDANDGEDPEFGANGGGPCLVPGNDVYGPCLQGQLGCLDGRLECVQTRSPSDVPEGNGTRCNGIDDDCDNEIDEGCACLPGDQRPCGTDTGECTTGISTCNDTPNGPAWSRCSGDVGPRPETENTCDNKDQDCDGTADAYSVTCYTGPTGTAGKGICHTGNKLCVAGRWLNCQDEQTPRTELCNNVDDDCDEQVDEWGVWPSPDGLEPNDTVDTPRFVAQTSWEWVNSPNNLNNGNSPTYFHSTGDQDHFYWFLDHQNNEPAGYWMCRVLNIGGQHVNLWLGLDIGSPPPAGQPFDTANLVTDVPVSSGAVVAIGPFGTPRGAYWLGGGVIQADGFTPCKPNYRLECKLTQSPQW